MSTEALDDIGIENLARQHSEIRKLMPSAWDAFYSRFSQLRQIQLEASPVILKGRNSLLISATATGKTEAAIAPLCQRAVSQKWGPFGIIVITPTRALVNDLFHRLEVPCTQLGISITRKTADHAIAADPKEQILVTTPESLESLLTFRREHLVSVRALVLDEIHLLDGTPRGDQLRLVIGRIRAFLESHHREKFQGLQIVALSATVSDPDRLRIGYLGNDSDVIRVPGQREIYSRVLLAAGEESERVAAALSYASSEFQPKKILVFVNSRKQVDSASKFFKRGEFANYSIFGHHGNLSKWNREQVEERFRSSSHAICVATMTLEVGIDIGDVDLVICMDPPFSISSFLQRVGRGCRRLKGITRVLCVARDRASELVFHAIIAQAAKGIPETSVPPIRRSVLVQQILAYLRQVPKHRRTANQIERIFAMDTAPVIDIVTINEILNDMAVQGLIVFIDGVIEPASAGWNIIESPRILSNIASAPTEQSVIDSETGKVVATIQGLNKTSRTLQVAGVSYDLVHSSDSGVHRVRKSEREGQSPTYHVRSLPYSADVGRALAAFFKIEDQEIQVIQSEKDLIVFTWLGKLQNQFVVEALCRTGIRCKASAFAITISRISDKEVIGLLKALNALPDDAQTMVKVESHVDMGPFFHNFSDTGKQEARQDWRDIQFLEKWAGRIKQVATIESGDENYDNLLSVSRL